MTIVDAGGAGDTLDFSQAATGVTVNLASTAAQRIFGGTVPLTLSAAPIENVIGTALSDRITGNARANRIFGGDGDDVLNGAAGNDLIFGELGNDTIQGGAGRDAVLGGDGDDILRVGNGRNLIIGGLGADDIRGNSGSDLLIGGRTIYDESEADLLAILAEWGSARTINARVANLTNGLGPSLSPFLRPGESVLDDETADSIFGGLGQDWFLSFAGDNVLDRGAADR
jgi:Ca2+-binding RTX toxin-like protein